MAFCVGESADKTVLLLTVEIKVSFISPIFDGVVLYFIRLYILLHCNNIIHLVKDS